MAEPARAAPEPQPAQGVRRLAESLRREGRAQDAVVLYEHLAELAPGDLALQRGLVSALGASGRTLDALYRLMAMKPLMPDAAEFLAEIREHSKVAAEKYNLYVQAGRIDQAELYASALAALIPTSEPMLNAALACNRALGRNEEVLHYARALLVIDPNHEPARAALAAVLAEEQGTALDGRIDRVLAPAEELHPLVRLRNLHDLAGRMLSRPLDPEDGPRLQRLVDGARELQVNAEPGTEWVGWEKHYRLVLEAIDVAAVLGPTPEPRPEPEVEFMASDGTAMSRADVRAAADRLGARAVFFVAADASYVELYARWYVLSILKHCDVPFLMVVHVIGGAGALDAAAAAVGVSDERLIYAGDRFDAAAVTTRCYDAPPKGMAARPIAHFQSVRFMRLGELLETVGRPVFVSDIDLLLQRGVADLLDQHDGADVVFNENQRSWNAGSRLTANLMLVGPTPKAGQFLRFVRAYLERALAGEEVTRWIDQLTLLLGKHHMERQGPAPRIGYFDTASDINNVMYPSYQENPFRFLSLYHGFDTSSLEGVA
jgi:tetratricopeptide (TPR) repeat protein